ncbi:MAG: hypothetical protein IPO92_21925 [Saprospiraceae bacterium]|nr:hypothetical protein [Saprospiraceae bacterium]
MFNGRRLLISTKHQKEKVIAPILEKELGVKCVVATDFDTDELGTFTGEVERKDDPTSTARNKCIQAMGLTGCDLAIASEGSFGPHPSLFYIPADDEILLFLDRKNNVEIVVRELSTETNFHGADVKNESELRAFANGAQFPSHGLICRKSKDDFTDIVKGITDWTTLTKTYHHFLNQYESFYVETDMRAMYNPSRMKVIGIAAQKLADKIKTLCPICHWPGFGITDAKAGLPCEFCNFPTRSVLSYMYSCQKCGHSKEEMFPNGKISQDAMYCDMCNP